MRFLWTFPKRENFTLRTSLYVLVGLSPGDQWWYASPCLYAFDATCNGLLCCGWWGAFGTVLLEKQKKSRTKKKMQVGALQTAAGFLFCLQFSDTGAGRQNDFVLTIC